MSNESMSAYRAAMGRRIKERRELLGMSQAELAAKLSYRGKGSISRIESGETEVGQSALPRLAEVLETDVAYLMGWTALAPETKPLTDDEKELLQYYREMNNQGKLSALMSVKGMSEQAIFKKEPDIASNG